MNGANCWTVIEHLGVDGINGDSNSANKGHIRRHMRQRLILVQRKLARANNHQGILAPWECKGGRDRRNYVRLGLLERLGRKLTEVGCDYLHNRNREGGARWSIIYTAVGGPVFF